MNIKRNFILGDEWLYYKIYTGINVSDRILIDLIKPVTDNLISNNIIDKWFFIRYQDPEHHLRVRFHATCKDNIKTIIEKLNPLLNNFFTSGIIWKIQTDTYKRELERYGKNTMIISEDYFHIDSSLTLDIINLVNETGDEDLRWLSALLTINSILDDFKFSLQQKLNFVKNLNERFGNEFNLNTNKSLRKYLNNKYRKEYDKIESIIMSKTYLNYNFNEFNLKRNNQSTHIIKQILHVNNLEIPLNYYIDSLIHMSINRLFKSKNRLNEMVCYNFLFRYYKGLIARNKTHKSKINI